MHMILVRILIALTIGVAIGNVWVSFGSPTAKSVFRIARHWYCVYVLSILFVEAVSFIYSRGYFVLIHEPTTWWLINLTSAACALSGTIAAFIQGIKK